VAEATVEEVQLLKTLRWWDGFIIALCNPGFLLGSLGYTLGIFGVIGSMTLWGCSALLGMLQAWIYSEPATMFGHRSGGISLYAHEGWRRYSTLVGPLSAFGYWIGWSVVLSIFGKVIGDLTVSQWFPHANQDIFSIGSNPVGVSDLIAIGMIIGVWAFNIFGVRPAVWVSYLTAGLLMIPLAVMTFGGYLSGDWHSANVHATWTGPWGGVKLALVYMFILAWSAYGTEVNATFAPEYHDTKRDTHRALRSSAMFMLMICVLLPLGLGGVTGAVPSATAEGQFYTQALAKIVGGGAGFFTACIIASLTLSMMSSTADAGRALFGISRADMTIKLFGTLNRFHVPARAMTMDLVVNVCLVLFIKSNLAILYMSNIGYVLCHVFALSGFLLLRKDRPNWPRPIRIASGWVPVVALLFALNLMFLLVGALAPHLNGYGSWTDFAIGIGVLLGSLLLFVYRRVVEDGARLRLRDLDAPSMPSDAEMAELGLALAPTSATVSA
jgi:amino acid transporter